MNRSYDKEENNKEKGYLLYNTGNIDHFPSWKSAKKSDLNVQMVDLN